MTGLENVNIGDWKNECLTSQKLSEVPKSLRSPLEDILGSSLQHRMMAAAGKTAEERKNAVH